MRHSIKDVAEIQVIYGWAAKKLRVVELFLDEDRIDKNRGRKRAVEA